MRVGVDLGGTKIEIIVLSEHGEQMLRQRVDAPHGSYALTLNAIVDLVEAVSQQFFTGRSLPQLGLGMPGAISAKTGRVKNANSSWLIGEDLPGDLSKRLDCPVKVENDANCFVFSEAHDGAAKYYTSVFGAIIGTGTGAGISINGKLLDGANAIAGEWGHNPLPWPQAHELPGQPCYCGKSGCIETWLSGPGFSEYYFQRSQQRLSVRQILALAESGQYLAEECLQQYEDRLARALATVINILDPDAIVLGGGMSNITRLYQNVPRLWGEYVFSDQVVTALLPPKYGDSSGVRGAAWL